MTPTAHVAVTIETNLMRPVVGGRGGETVAKSTMETVLDAIRIVNSLDRKGRIQVYHYLGKEFADNPMPLPLRRERKKRETKEGVTG